MYNSKDRLSYSLGLGYTRRSGRLQSVVFISPLDDSSVWQSEMNHQKFIKEDLYFGAGVKYKLNKFTFTLGFRAKYLITNLQEFQQEIQQKENAYFEPNFNLSYKIKENQNLGFNYIKKYQFTDAYMLNKNPIISSLQGLNKGFSSFEDIMSESYSLRYSYGRWSDMFNFHADLSYTRDHDYFTHKLHLEQDFSYMEQLLAKNRESVSMMSEVNQYLDALRMNLKLSAQYSEQKYQQQLNSDIFEDVEIQSIFLQLGLKSSFSGIFNYEVEGKYSRLQSKSASRFTSESLSASAGLYFSLTPKLSLSKHFETYHFFNSELQATDFIDFNLSYKTTLFSKNFHFVLEGKNLLNNNKLYNTSISDYSSSNETYRLLPRMIMLNVNWSF